MNECAEPTLEERVRATGRFTRGDTIATLRSKIEQIRSMETETKRTRRIGVTESIVIESMCGWLQHAILRRLEERRP